MIPPPSTLEPWMHEALAAAATSVCSSREGYLTRSDMYQEGYLMLGYILSRFDPTRGMKPEKYVFAALCANMRKLLINFREKRTPERLPEEFVPAARVERSETAERREGIDAICALTRGLRPQSIELFRLRFIEGIPRQQIARALGIRPMGVTKRLRTLQPVLRARARRLIGAA